MVRLTPVITLLAAAVCTVVPAGEARRPPGAASAEAAAAAVDAQLEKALLADGAEIAPITSDEDFLRRVSLDLTGQIPTVREVSLFVLDPASDKRARLIDRLLESDSYSTHWASYWADVIFSRATEPRARTAQGTFETWMKSRLAENAPWDAITTELLTATGRTRSDGQTALIFAHLGDAEELAAETSRIFLGIQIQCASCHDHPTDRWKREQFHQLAAYFPRITVRRDRNAMPVEYVVTSFAGVDRRDPEELLKLIDRNGDEKISAEEARRAPRLRALFRRMLEQADADKDGSLTLEELRSLPVPNQNGRGSAEHFMPDLNDPTSRGTAMHPEFFVDQTKLKAGTEDAVRRRALAKHITSKGNPWFRKAFVNRMWSELLGEGFVMPIDDLGPERTSQHEEVLDLLANGFSAHDYDIRWLLRAITSTQAYQRRLAPNDSESHSFAAAAPTRLRADQIYNALMRVLDVEQLGGLTTRGRGQYGRGNDPRRGFQSLFGYDPSTPQDDVLGTIPQALFLMNSPPLARFTRADGETVLARILKDHERDEDALSELYLRTLSREPSANERQFHLAYLQEVGQRQEAFEDIFWVLLNSSEFVTKR